MMMKDKGKLVIWPAYLDQTRSRSSGRIISRKNSIKEPNLNEIKEAARHGKSAGECSWMIKVQNPLLQSRSLYQ